MVKLNAAQLRTSEPSEKELASIVRKPIYLILDNVLDTYNIGSIFRLADAVGVAKIYICGESLTPPHTRIKKASVNTWRWVPWEYAKSASKAIDTLRKEVKGITVFAVEQSEKSKRYDTVKYDVPLTFVVGNETHGVSKETLTKVDQIVELPMHGVNKSLNVMVSTGIVLYQILSQLN